MERIIQKILAIELLFNESATRYDLLVPESLHPEEIDLINGLSGEQLLDFLSSIGILKTPESCSACSNTMTHVYYDHNTPYKRRGN